MDAEEGAGVLVGELDGGVGGGHVRRHQRRVRARLDDEVLESDALFFVSFPPKSTVSSRSKRINQESKQSFFANKKRRKPQPCGLIFFIYSI